jgi:hypothetical protein
MVTELRRGLAQETMEAAVPAMAARLVEIALTSRSHRASIEAITVLHAQIGTGKGGTPRTLVDYEVIDAPGTQDERSGEDPGIEEGVSLTGVGMPLNTESIQGPIPEGGERGSKGLQERGGSGSVVPFQRLRGMIPKHQKALHGVRADMMTVRARDPRL